MVEQGPASEDEVVLAFLRAEVDSPKWGPNYSALLAAHHLERQSLIDAADLSDYAGNAVRRSVLGHVRGYGRGVGLFQGFPSDTSWRRVLIEPPDFHRLKYISADADWLNLSGGTRLVQDGARNLHSNSRIEENVRGAQQEVAQARGTAELILVEADGGALVIVEGHTRATAYAVLSDRPFEAFVGVSPLMKWWAFI